VTDVNPKPCDKLIRNALVVTMDANRTVYPRGAIAIAGGELVAVGPRIKWRSHFNGN
jgi:predicted amidohydrolase YtcJ